MKYKLDDIILIRYDRDVRAFERITKIVDKKISTKLLYDFYYRSEIVSDIEFYDDFEEGPMEGGKIIDKWTRNDMEVFLMLET